ncbi:MAG: GAF domain-containing protein, partial [Chloroflexi bacterium]|nr:GAF domain-containing protein [Chloroflexota bacterium]
MREKIREVLNTFGAAVPASDEARRRRLLDFILAAIAIGAALGLLFVLATLVVGYADSPADLRNTLVGVALTLACVAVIFVLNRRLSTDLAALFLVALLLVIVLVLDAPAQVANGRGLLRFALPIVIAAVLVRPWAGFVVAGLSSLALIGLALDPSAGPPNVFAMVVFFMLAGLVGYATAIQERVLRELRTANAAQANSNAERQQVEAQRDATLAELAQERNLLRTLIDNLPDTIYAKDTEARFILNNAAQLRTLGVSSPEASLGKSDFDFHPPELAARYYADDQAVIASGQPLLAREEPVRDQTTGAVAQKLTTKVPLRDAEGRVVGLVGIGRDITELKEAQAAERSQRLLAEALRDAAAAVASTLSFDEVLDRILAELDRVVSHDAARIMLIEDGVACGVRGRGYDERPPAAPITTLRLPVTEAGNLRTMVETGRPFVVSDTATYPGWIVHPQQPWVRSSASAPLSVRGQVIGFLSVDSATPGFFTPAHAERLQAFADQAAVALENARLHEDAQRRNRELALLNQVAELASRPTAPAAMLQ